MKKCIACDEELSSALVGVAITVPVCMNTECHRYGLLTAVFFEGE